MDKTQVEYVLEDIRVITENVIIKMSSEAALYETVESKRQGDIYVAAMNEKDIFSSYRNYPIDVLAKAGITDLNVLTEYYEDKWKIPHAKRKTVLKYMRESIINEYEELNDYYRELIGKPPINTPEEEFIYLTEAQMQYYKIDEVRPIHDYPQEIQIKLERVVIPELIALYPERTYLRHMGSKSVNLVRAREAKNFEIIFADAPLDEIFLRAFFETYDFSREYFMSVIYNKNFTGIYNLYDNFIAMNIMIMTIQRLIVDMIKTSIDRDFFDLISIKKLCDCYGVPFFEDLPLDYQRMIVKNLNMLIRAKSTDKVLYDIANVLMYERIQIYKYYLVKERLTDEEGEPLFIYKTIQDDEGNDIQVLDYEKMYDVYFQATDIMEPNVIVAIENKANKYYYDEVTKDDVYWWETDELKKELYEREYNFIDTKYLGINLMQNLTNLLYDTCYFLNTLVDNKDTTTPIETRILNSDAMKTGTDYLYLVLDRFTTIPVSIFDTVVILCALVSKKNGMKGNIIATTPSKILSVMGFNFELNFDLIRENIQKYKRVFKDQSIVKYLDLLDIKTVEDIDTLYYNFKNFAEFCRERLATTTDIREYKAYKELYKVFTVREETGDAFRMENGEVAKTYMEYLYDKVPHIAEIINDLHKDKLGVYIEHVIGKLNELLPDIEYLSSLNGTNNNIVTALMSLINFFKSYTVDLRNLNVIYMFDNKALNKIYMIDDPRLFIKLFPVEKALSYNDNLQIRTKIDKSDNIIIYSNLAIESAIVPKEYFNTEHELFLSSSMKHEESMDLDYKDGLHLSCGIQTPSDEFITDDEVILEANARLQNDGFTVWDKLSPVNIIECNDKFDALDYNDNLSTSVTNVPKDKIKIRDMVKVIRED